MKHVPMFNKKQVMIAGTKYKVKIVNEIDKDGSLGETDRLGKVIKILKSQTELQKWETYFHELMHCITTESGVWQVLNDNMEQILAENFSKFMLSFTGYRK